MKTKEFLKKAWKFIKGKWFIYVVIAVLFILYLNQCQRTTKFKNKHNQSELNISAMGDTVKNERQKNGNMLSSIESLIISEKDLRNLNANLYKVVKNQKGKVVSLTNSIISLTQDKEMLESKLVDNDAPNPIAIAKNDSTSFVQWKLHYQWDSTNSDLFIGQTEFGLRQGKLWYGGTSLISRTSFINLTWGQKTEDGKLRVFVESSYPGFKAESLRGVLIDPNDNKLMRSLYKKRHWFTGLSIGPMVGFGYIIGSSPSIFLGVGITYNVYQW